MTQVKQKFAVRMNPDFLMSGNASKIGKKSVKKCTSKMVISELGKGVEMYDLITNLAQDQHV